MAFAMGILVPGLLFSVCSKIVSREENNPPSQSPTVVTEPTRSPQEPQQTTAQLVAVLMPEGQVEMNMETYLTGVLLAEMPVDFDTEALKAQAVVSRTYALRRNAVGNKHPQGAVCTESFCCQAYRSVDDFLSKGGTTEMLEKVTQAIVSTQDQVLTYNGALIEATYFSCSGGRTEDALAVWGTDITLSLSLAFARAVALRTEGNLTKYLQKLSSNTILNRRKKYLIPVFSGGVHDKGLPKSIQQIMFVIDSDDFQTTVDEILDFYGGLERTMITSGWLSGYSSSSGFMTNGLTVEMQLDVLTDAIQKSIYSDHISIALDVAAEHLKCNEGYRFYGKQLTADKMKTTLSQFAMKYPISYIEDPFDSNDREYWLLLREEIGNKCAIFADDFTATQAQFMDSEIADGVIIKMKQAGTLYETLKAVERTKQSDLMKCVSHRSYETEDSFMCDLGVAVNAEYMKIGGPRRGDRVSKYNQLLRIFSTFN